MSEVKINDQEIQAVYALLRSTLAPRAVREDPETRPLRSFARKLQRLAEEAHCARCNRPSVHAKGLCAVCYQAERRDGARSA